MAHSTVSKTVALWPPKFIQFLRTYCTETPSSFLVADLCAFDDVYTRVKLPAPIIRLMLDDLGYDVERKKLIGNPWSHVSSISQPHNLEFGRWCFADNGRSKVFCGVGSENSYLFDTELGTWTKLPPMPEFGGYMAAAGVFRVGSRIYVLLDYGASICFDLAVNQWVDSGIHTFPGDAFTNFTTVVLNDGTVIVAGGWVMRGGAFDWSQQVFALNTSTGVWTQMPDLPEIFSDDEHPLMGYCITTARHPDGLAVVMGNNTWVLLMDGHWEVNPILQRAGLKALRLDRRRNKVFVGDGFIELPTQENVDGATVEFSCWHNCSIVR